MTILLGFLEFLDKHADGLGFLVLIVVMVIGATLVSIYADGGSK